jgi:hypothetical protein
MWTLFYKIPYPAGKEKIGILLDERIKKAVRGNPRPIYKKVMFVASPSFFDGYYSTNSAFANQEKNDVPSVIEFIDGCRLLRRECQNGSCCGWGLILQVL